MTQNYYKGKHFENGQYFCKLINYANAKDINIIAEWKAQSKVKGTFGVTVCMRITAHKMIDIPATMTETATDWLIGGIYISKKLFISWLFLSQN